MSASSAALRSCVWLHGLRWFRCRETMLAEAKYQRDDGTNDDQSRSEFQQQMNRRYAIAR